MDTNFAFHSLNCFVTRMTYTQFGSIVFDCFYILFLFLSLSEICIGFIFIFWFLSEYEFFLFICISNCT